MQFWVSKNVILLLNIVQGGYYIISWDLTLVEQLLIDELIDKGLDSYFFDAASVFMK